MPPTEHQGRSDGVFNHSSRLFFSTMSGKWPPFPWVDWFKIEGWLPPYNGEFPANYAGWAGNRALPVFNHDNLKWNTLWRLLNTD